MGKQSMRQKHNKNTLNPFPPFCQMLQVSGVSDVHQVFGISHIWLMAETKAEMMARRSYSAARSSGSQVSQVLTASRCRFGSGCRRSSLSHNLCGKIRIKSRAIENILFSLLCTRFYLFEWQVLLEWKILCLHLSLSMFLNICILFAWELLV